MNIRLMTMKDYNGVYNLWINTPGMSLNNIDDSREGIEKFLDRNPNTCFVAINENEIIGVIICGHDGRRGYIYHTAVKSSERYRGIGKSLLKSAIEGLKKEGINKIALVVFSKNELGNKFWESCGFTNREDLVYRNKAIKELVRIDT